MEEAVTVFWPLNYEMRGQYFFNQYNIERIITCPINKVKRSKPKSTKVCRFCGKDEGTVSFRKEAHIISKLLGNENLVSDYECDQCNSLFSSYESHLSYFIGPFRAFQRINGTMKNKIFQVPNEKIVTENISFQKLEKCVSISREDYEDQTFEFNRESGETVVTLTKNSYRPLLVYKSVLKMALSCLPDKDIPEYKLAFRYLNSNVLDKNTSGAANLLIYTMPLNYRYDSPIAFLFRKKIYNAEIYTHIFALYFMNHIYQIFLPFNIKDISAFNDKLVDVYYSPPCFYEEAVAKSIQIIEQYRDMSSSELVKGEKDCFKFKYDQKEYSDAVVYDPKTKEMKDRGFNENAITKLIFTDENAIFSFD